MKIYIYSQDTSGLNLIKEPFSLLQKLFSSYIRKRLQSKIKFNEIPTHTSGFAFSAYDEDYTLEARPEGVEVGAVNKPKWQFEFFDSKDDAEIYKTIRGLFWHKAYGYFELPNFIKRWLLHFILKDDRKVKPLLKWMSICTEVVYHWLVLKAEKLGKPNIKYYLSNWNSNQIFAIEILEICEYLDVQGLGTLTKLS